MATIPSGSLVFTGYGDSGTMRYLSPAGVLLGQPYSAPQPGSGVWGITPLIGASAIAVVGGNTPNFGSTGTGTFNSDGTFRAQYLHGGGTTYAGVGVGRDDAGCFYSTKGSSTNLRIFKYDADAQLQSSWTVAMGFTIGSVQAIGVNGAGTIAYVHIRKSSGATAAEVYAIDLSGAGSSSGVFASDATSTTLQGQTCVISLTNGDVIIAWRDANNVKRYNAAGTLQATYTLPGSLNPMALAYGLTPSTTFWAAAYSSATTFSTTTVYEVRISDGTILHQFDPEDGSFEFDSSFAVIRTPMTSTPQVVPVDTSVPCCDTGGVSGGGSAAGPVLPAVSTDWTPRCTGGGTVPTASDLTTSEDWSA